MERTQERKQFLADVFTTAIEGGINYWSQVEAYHWQGTEGRMQDADLDGFYAEIIEIGDGDVATKHRIDVNVIAHGLNLLCGSRKEPIKYAPTGRLLADLMLANRTNGQDGDFDADSADCVVQAGLFGEIVYG